MKLEVNQDLCIGCGACQAVCPEVFEINDNGVAQTIVDSIDDSLVESATDAKEGCPVAAIEDIEEKNDENE